MSFNLYIFVSFFFTLVYHMHFSRIIKESLLIHIFYVMALFVERKKKWSYFPFHTQGCIYLLFSRRKAESAAAN